MLLDIFILERLFYLTYKYLHVKSNIVCTQHSLRSRKFNYENETKEKKKRST